jgi:O-antigen/teichoic acid export membrane protein
MSSTAEPQLRGAEVATGIAILMALEASTLALMSVLHLTGILGGGTGPFRRTDAGVAEAVICVVLIGGATALARDRAQGHRFAFAAIVFAILGFIVGLNFTIRDGDAIDIAYHATVLLLLIATLVVLTRGQFPGRNRGSAG